MVLRISRRLSRLPSRAVAVALVTALVVAGLATGGASRAAADTPTTQTPVMGPNLLSADQLVRWYQGRGYTPRLPNLGNDVRALAQLFIDEGAREGVRGDMAFVQGVLETGGFNFPDYGQIRPEFNNFGGINAYDGRRKGTTCADEKVYEPHLPSRCFPSPEIGVRANIHLLRGYADPLTRGMTDRVRMPPSDRIGVAPIWELFGGALPAGCTTSCTKPLIWASSLTYASSILSLYSDALVRSGARAACLPYFPGSNDKKSGNGYWVATSDSALYSYGSAKFYGNPVGLRLNKPIINGESRSDGTGYWLLGEDGGIFAYGNAGFYGSTGGMRLNQPVLGMERTKSGKGYWLFARDGGVFAFGDAKFFGSLGGRSIPAAIVSMQRTASGNGYWMLGADGSVYPFGDATRLGGVEGCSNYGFATRMLVTPTGNGYWIVAATGAVIPFGDARRLGFPSRLGGIPVALMYSP